MHTAGGQGAPIPGAPRDLLTKADCRARGMTRPDVDRMFDRVPVICLPESSRPYVRWEDYRAWIDQHARTAPRHARSAA